ncbi:MAG: helix-turn-helix domain-containing protein [Gammaproteobacteria bacterium]
MTKRVKIEKGSGNVFQDIGFPPHEAYNLHMRAELMVKVETFVDKSGLTQKEAAKLLGLTQPRLNDVLKGKIDKFSLDALVNMLARAGMKVKLTVRRAA